MEALVGMELLTLQMDGPLLQTQVQEAEELVPPTVTQSQELLEALEALESSSYVTPSINRHPRQQQATLRSIMPMVIRYIHGRLPGQLLFKEN